MRTKTLLATVATTLVALAACGSSSIVSGEMRLYEVFETDPFYTYEWPDDGGFECDDPTSDLAFNGNGTITGGATTDTVIEISSTWYHVHTEVTVTGGTWAQPPPAQNIAGTLDILATYRVVSGPEDCDPEGEACDVTFDNIAFVGSTDTANPLPTFAPGDTITITGQNSDFETTVTGAVSTCGGLIALNNGRIELVDVVIEV